MTSRLPLGNETGIFGLEYYVPSYHIVAGGSRDMYAMIEFFGAIGLILTGYLALRGVIETSLPVPRLVPVRASYRRPSRGRP